MKSVPIALALTLFCRATCLAQGKIAEPRPVSSGMALGVNVAIGAATAAIGRVSDKKTMPRAFAKGATAGAMIFGAKWIVSKNYVGTNLLGRSIGAVGSSAVLNSARNRAMFERMAIPYGPVRFHVDTRSKLRVRMKLDLAAAISAAQSFADDEIKFDGERSFSSGVMTFRADTLGAATPISGMHTASVVAFRPASVHQSVLESDANRTIGHELVHVVQYDFLFNAVGSAVEDKLMPLIPGGRAVHRFVDIGFHSAVWAGINAGVPYAKRPWEREATSLADR